MERQMIAGHNCTGIAGRLLSWADSGITGESRRHDQESFVMKAYGGAGSPDVMPATASTGQMMPSTTLDLQQRNDDGRPWLP